MAVHLAPAGIKPVAFNSHYRAEQSQTLCLLRQLSDDTQVLVLLSCRLRGNVQLTAFVPALSKLSKLQVPRKLRSCQFSFHLS